MSLWLFDASLWLFDVSLWLFDVSLWLIKELQRDWSEISYFVTMITDVFVPPITLCPILVSIISQEHCVHYSYCQQNQQYASLPLSTVRLWFSASRILVSTEDMHP